jgi:2,3-bisphosphoglycerate-dependent phosphoglycerate mutase
MKARGLDFDLTFTSFQSRAIKTLHLALEEMGRLWLPEEKDWRLNERHYGGLTGLDKAETAAKHGDDQVKLWRRSFDVPPPLPEGRLALGPGQGCALQGRADPADRKPERHDRPRAALLEGRIVPELRAGKRVLISAHGNSLRALVMHLSKIPQAEITGLEIPTGQPIVYELDEGLNEIERYYLKDR